MALVSLANFRTFAGLDPADDAVAQIVLDGVEAMLLAELGRPHVPFQAEQENRVEIYDGTDAPWLTLQHAIKGTSGVKSLVIAGTTIATTGYVYVAGGRRLVRVDGGTFGDYGEPATVVVTYDALGDEPTNAAVAILRVAAAIMRQRGSEDAASESLGPYSATYARAAADDPVWLSVLHTGVWTRA